MQKRPGPAVQKPDEGYLLPSVLENCAMSPDPLPTKSLTYGRFKRFLENLGLRYERRPKTEGRPAAHVYVEPDGQPFIIFPQYRSTETVRPHHLLAMRRLLIEKGYVVPEDFTRFLQQRETA